jgi:hypothetical protein
MIRLFLRTQAPSRRKGVCSPAEPTILLLIVLGLSIQPSRGAAPPGDSKPFALPGTPLPPGALYRLGERRLRYQDIRRNSNLIEAVGQTHSGSPAKAVAFYRSERETQLTLHNSLIQSRLRQTSHPSPREKERMLLNTHPPSLLMHVGFRHAVDQQAAQFQ